MEKSAAIVTTWGDQGVGLNPDATVAKIVGAADERVAPLVNRLVGVAQVAITRAENAAGESTLGNLIADAQRASAGAQFAFMNPGGIRDDLNAGEVLWGELFAIQPFSNDVVGDQGAWLEPEMTFQAELLDGQPVGLQLPSSMEYTIVETAPVMKSATKTASTKPAKLSNGVTIQVPEFIGEGERVRVNPREGVYLERAK